MKAYRGVDGKIRIFRPNMNMNRMNLAAKRSGLPTFEGVEFIKCLARLISIDSEWVPHTEAASLYIRPTLIGIDVCLSKLHYFIDIMFDIYKYIFIVSLHWVWRRPIQHFCMPFSAR